MSLTSRQDAALDDARAGGVDRQGIPAAARLRGDPRGRAVAAQQALGRLGQWIAPARWRCRWRSRCATSLVFILPLTAALIEGAAQGQALLDWLARAQTTGMPPPDWLTHLPVVGHRAAIWWQEHMLRAGHAGQRGDRIRARQRCAQWALAMGSQIASRSLLLLVGLMALFCILRDGRCSRGQVRRFAPRLQLGAFGDRFLDQMVLAVRGTVVGTLAVAIGEGVLIGLGYAVAGVPHPLFLALLTAAFAMLPFGAWIVFGGRLGDPRDRRASRSGPGTVRLGRRGDGDRRQPGHPLPRCGARAAPAAAVRLCRGIRRTGGVRAWSGSSSVRWSWPGW